jgi:hypothetical protein
MVVDVYGREVPEWVVKSLAHPSNLVIETMDLRRKRVILSDDVIKVDIGADDIAVEYEYDPAENWVFTGAVLEELLRTFPWLQIFVNTLRNL